MREVREGGRRETRAVQSRDVPWKYNAVLIQNVPVATFESKETCNIYLNNRFLTQYIQNMIISICTNMKITSELLYVLFSCEVFEIRTYFTFQFRPGTFQAFTVLGHTGMDKSLCWILGTKTSRLEHGSCLQDAHCLVWGLGQRGECFSQQHTFACSFPNSLP